MEFALIGKLIVEATAAAAVLVAALLFLKDRRAARAAELGDRAAERASLLGLVENAIGHNTSALEANTKEQRAATKAIARLASGLDVLAERLAARPCLREQKNKGANHER